MNPTIVAVENKTDLKRFVMFPYQLYKGNRYWVPPLIKDAYGTVDIKSNSMFQRGEHILYLAVSGGKVTGRICTGIDAGLNRIKSTRFGYVTLFECINDYETAKALLDKASAWLKERGMDTLRGPISPSGADSDEYKGMLVDAFDLPPVIMNSYNPPYYKELFEKYGFEKELDLYAYKLVPDELFRKDPNKTLDYAEKRYNFRVETMDLKHNLDRDVRDIKHVMDIAMPEEWEDLAPPSLEEVYGMADRLLPIADPDILVIARSGDEAVGFGIAIPDYNQVLLHLKGRITPLAAVKYLWYKRKINCARFFIMFVVPSFRKKGVSYAIYHKIFTNGIKKGYTWGEGSTIGETNVQMRSDIENLGGQRYKTYRIYSKPL